MGNLNKEIIIMDGEEPVPEAAQGIPTAVDPAPETAPVETNADAPVAVGEDGLPLPPQADEKTNIPEETMADMKALWDVFDMEETNHVPIRELRVILRALDLDMN